MEKRPDYFDKIAEDFAAWVNPFDLSERQQWFTDSLSSLDICGKLVLDVGSGLGHFSELVQMHGGRTVSLDLAWNLLRRAKPRTPNCLQGNALQLPFPDETFYCVISSECIEHTAHPHLAIEEMVRVLKPAGVLLLSTPNRVWRWSISIAEVLNIRKFRGIENWLGRRETKLTLKQSGARILADAGLHLFPFQLKPLWPILGLMNRRAQVFRHCMINQCWVAQKL